MERGSIYVDGDHVTGIGAETPRSINGRGLGGGQVEESRGVMQELTMLGRNSGAHSEETARTGEFQAKRSVVGGRRGADGCREEEVLASHCLWLWWSLGAQFLYQQWMHLNVKVPNTCKNQGERYQTPQHLVLLQRSAVVGISLGRTSRGPLKLVIIVDGEFLCGLKIIVGSIWRAST